MKFLSVYKTVERNAPPTQEEMDKFKTAFLKVMA